MNLLGLFLLLSPNEFDNIEKLQHVIVSLQPRLTERQSIELAVAVNKYTEEYDLPTEKFLAILFQESSLFTDPTGCLKNIDNCSDDYGLGQVNYRVWGKHLGMSKHQALVDVDYSVQISALIFKHYKDKYSKKDKDWMYRYHSKTPYFKRLYKERVLAVYDTIKTEIEDFSNDKRQRNTATGTYCNYIEGQEKIPVRVFESLVYNVRR